MKHSLIWCAAIFVPASAMAQHADPLTNEQAASVYGQCLALTAISRRFDVADEAIYGVAKDACSTVRASLLVGHEANQQRIIVLNSIDARMEARLPSLIKKSRERHQTQGTEAESISARN